MWKLDCRKWSTPWRQRTPHLRHVQSCILEDGRLPPSLAPWLGPITSSADEHKFHNVSKHLDTMILPAGRYYLSHHYFRNYFFHLLVPNHLEETLHSPLPNASTCVPWSHNRETSLNLPSHNMFARLFSNARQAVYGHKDHETAVCWRSTILKNCFQDLLQTVTIRRYRLDPRLCALPERSTMFKFKAWISCFFVFHVTFGLTNVLQTKLNPSSVGFKTGVCIVRVCMGVSTAHAGFKETGFGSWL